MYIAVDVRTSPFDCECTVLTNNGSQYHTNQTIIACVVYSRSVFTQDTTKLQLPVYVRHPHELITVKIVPQTQFSPSLVQYCVILCSYSIIRSFSTRAHRNARIRAYVSPYVVRRARNHIFVLTCEACATYLSYQSFTNRLCGIQPG